VRVRRKAKSVRLLLCKSVLQEELGYPTAEPYDHQRQAFHHLWPEYLRRRSDSRI